VSHLTTTETQYKDVDALRAAVEKFGLKLETGGQCRFFSGKPNVDFLVPFPGRYDVGFKWNNKGTLDIVCDSEMYRETIYSGEKSQPYAMWGNGFAKLIDEYSAQVLTREYEMQGYSVQREEVEGGGIKLVATQG
jgi:hypothetical protein